MTKLSANKAAEAAHVAKTTLLDALKSGELSATKNSKGHWEIDPAELFRVFPKESPDQTEKPNPTPDKNGIEAIILQVKLDVLQERFEEAQTRIQNLQKEKEAMRTDYRQSLAVLNAPTPQKVAEPPQPQPRTERPRAGFWARLTGQGA